VLVTVWAVLEEHRIGSPRVTVEHHPDGLTDLVLMFRTADAEAFQSVWSGDRIHGPRHRAS